jgi:carbonic anhydrase
MNQRYLIGIAVLGLVTATSPLTAAGPGPHWGYAGHEGPAHWGQLDKGFAPCKLGKEQSPIDIKGAAKAQLPAIAFDYKGGPLKVINNGHTVQVNFDKGSSIKVGDKRYDLLQTHFHTPSEELVNGKAYDMVWHLVHKSAEGKLAVVGVLVKSGAKNSAIETVSANLPGQVGKEQAAAGATINPATLLPANRGYYHFMGSLTTPPCSEGVSWYVLKEPIEAAPEQIKKFSAIFGSNARPVQPLNARSVKESL